MWTLENKRPLLMVTHIYTHTRIHMYPSRVNFFNPFWVLWVCNNITYPSANYGHIDSVAERISHFCLVRNLIRPLGSTHNFTNQDDLSYSSFWAAPIGEAVKRPLWLNNFVQCRRLTVCSSIAAAASTQWGKQSNLWTPRRLFLLDQGFPVEYVLDKFNAPHAGTTLRHPQNWLCRLRCNNTLWHLATSSPSNIFWRHSRFSPKQPEPQTHDDFNVSLLKQQTRLVLHYGEHISLAHPTMP